MRSLNFVFIFAICVCFKLAAQEVTIRTDIDTNQILIGEQINLRYLITHHPDVKVLPPFLQQNITEGVELIGDVEVSRNDIDNRSVEDKFNYIITAFDTGVYYIPPQPFLLEFEGMTDTLFSKATYLVVYGVQIDTTNTIRDIKDVQHVPLTFRDILPYLLIVLAFLGLLAGVYFYFKHNKKIDTLLVGRSRPEEPPHLIALRELDKLKAEKLWQQNEIKEYYSRLSGIVRSYIEKRFKFSALEQTTKEILDVFKLNYKTEKIDYYILEELLNLSDLVKFAKGKPSPEENIKLLENSYKFVKDTKVEIIEEEEIIQKD